MLAGSWTRQGPGSQAHAGIIDARPVTRVLVHPIDTAPIFDETDPLTGLASWKAVQQRLAVAFETPEDGSVGVIRCAVDRFDWINDGLGLGGGDEALRQIAEILRAAYPPPAVVGRLGGDEFIIALPVIRDAQEVPASTRALEARLRAPLRVEGQAIFASLSVGSATASRGAPAASSAAAAERIIREAGAAMRLVEEGRRSEPVGAPGGDLLRLDADLHRALDRGEIVAYYQPQYDARDGSLTGYEALARWQHPEHGTVSPDRFIPLAEADGLIERLGHTILEQACRFADLVGTGPVGAGPVDADPVRADPDRVARPLQMAVNVSTRQLSVPGLADRVQRVLEDHPDRAWTLTVEITESALIRNQDVVLAELDRLRDLGVGVSVDDFGSGYSSLTRLRHLPATELKIDRTFVEQPDEIGTGILAAIIGLARALGLTVVAEGIGTRSQLESLRDLGCDQLQGMYLCPPLSAADALAARSSSTDLLPPIR